MPSEQQQLEAGIAALEAQRAILGDAVVESLLAPARAKLAVLQAAAAAEPTQTLKQVTILFLDVVGSTKLSQRLDPEEISAVMDGALSRGTAIVQAHRGRVLQYAGDNILAAFGADQAAEDDAERAVLCGMALLELGRTLGAEVQAAHGHSGLDVRVGIHTGAVLLGGGVDEAGSIRGISVNIAARLEQTAPAGAVQISQDTYGLVRGLFEVEPRGPQPVKGVDEPLHSYLVQRARPRSFRGASRGIEGVETNMIGRDAELGVLQEAFTKLYTEPRAEPALALVNVVGEAGVGKSRMLAEFARWTASRPERALLFRGCTTPQTLGRPFGLLGDLVTRSLRIDSDDTLEVARTKIQQAVIPLFVDDEPDQAEGHAHLLGHLLGFDWHESPHLKGILQDPKQIRNRAFHAAAQMFRRLSAREHCPVILLLEDLHWADDESLAFLDYLVDVNRDAAMLAIAFTRPTLFERPAGRQDVGGPRLRIDLEPLDARASHDLAHELLKKLPVVPAALRELLTTGAEGNPFYMEELVRMLIDKGAITTGETWSLNADGLPATQVPTTLVGVLQARLDGLPAAEKLALQQASIIGPVFWDRALGALDPQAEAALPRLVQRELLVPSDVAGDGAREYTFKHHILYKVTYGTVLRHMRRAQHGKLARWLAANAEQSGGRHGDVLGIAAHHFERAGETADAAEFHARAAEHAVERFAHAAVLDHVERALALLDESAGRAETAGAQAPLRWRLLLAREQTNRLTGHRAEQRIDLATLGTLAETLALDTARAELARRSAGLALVLADWPAAEHQAREAMALAERLGDHAGRLVSQGTLALALRGQARLDDAQALAEQGLAESRERGLKQREWNFLRALALIYETQGHEMKSAEMELLAMAIARETGDRVGEALGLDCMGQVAIYVGDLAQAQRSFEDALRLQRQLGLRSMEAHAGAYLAAVMLWQGEDARALVVAREALDAARAAEQRYAEAWAQYRLGEAELALGRYAEAGEAMAAAAAGAQAVGVGLVHTATAGLARVALAQGQLGEALGHVETLLTRLPAGDVVPDTTFHPELVALTCYEVLISAGDVRADECLERARSLMLAVAQGITVPAQRESHLKVMPHRRKIEAAWRARHAGSH